MGFIQSLNTSVFLVPLKHRGELAKNLNVINKIMSTLGLISIWHKQKTHILDFMGLYLPMVKYNEADLLLTIRCSSNHVENIQRSQKGLWFHVNMHMDQRRFCLVCHCSKDQKMSETKALSSNWDCVPCTICSQDQQSPRSTSERIKCFKI